MRLPPALSCRPGGRPGPWIAPLAGAIAIGLAVAANAAPPAPAPAPTLAGAAANFIAFRDPGGTNYLLQAPRDFAWVRLFGTKGHPVTRSTSLTCPTRRILTAGTYDYTCSFVMADYSPGTYNVAPARVLREATADAVLTVDAVHSTLRIELRPTTVHDAAAKGRHITEPARTATLRQVRL